MKAWGAVVLQVSSGLAAHAGEREFHRSLSRHAAESFALLFCVSDYCSRNDTKDGPHHLPRS